MIKVVLAAAREALEAFRRDRTVLEQQVEVLPQLAAP